MEIFKHRTITAFKSSKNLKEIIGSNKTENSKAKKPINTFTQRKCSPCLANTGTLCCKQVQSISTFKCQRTKRFIKYFIKLIVKVNM